MSVSKVTVRELQGRYERGVPLTMMTAYDYHSGLQADASGVDMVLLGDSLGKVVLGRNTTLSVTLTEMAHHARAVRAGVHRALLVADMPFGTYEVSGEHAADSAIELVKSSLIDAVKLEGEQVAAAKAITSAGVPVMAHVGPVTDASEARGALSACVNMAAAGCFAVVFECLPSAVATRIMQHLKIPAIGIGSGRCDGQVLMYHDAVGLRGKSPSFAKRYAEVDATIRNALTAFRDDVIAGTFPTAAHETNDSGDWSEFWLFAEQQQKGNGNRSEVEK